MTYRYILGTGTMAKGMDEPFSGHTALLENLPIKDYIDPRESRRFGRLTKMIFIAAHRALKDAQIADITSIPMAVATCIGESRAALGLIEQIHQTAGVTVSPALVPNSVHNAAAGYLSIGLKNHSPSLTVSQGWLSSEAAMATALDMLDIGLSDRVLVSCGDEADPAWAERLTALRDRAAAQRLDAEAFEEGAAALVLGIAPCHRPLGVATAGVERWDGSPSGLKNLLSRRGIHPSASVEIRVRKSGGGKALRPILAEAFCKTTEHILFDQEGPGTVQTGPLAHLIPAARSDRTRDLLLMSREVDELAYVHWKRSL